MVVLIGLGRVFEALYIFLVPGLAWSFVFFARRDIDWLERLVISVAVSIGLVTLCVFWLNWIFHVKITELNVCLVVAGVAFVGLVCLAVKEPDFRHRLWDRIRNPRGSASDEGSQRSG
jgi:uncharacterized membrane protein